MQQEDDIVDGVCEDCLEDIPFDMDTIPFDKENIPSPFQMLEQFLEDFPEAHEMVMANLEKLGIEVPAQADDDDVVDGVCEDC